MKTKKYLLLYVNVPILEIEATLRNVQKLVEGWEDDGTLGWDKDIWEVTIVDTDTLHRWVWEYPGWYKQTKMCCTEAQNKYNKFLDYVEDKGYEVTR